MGAYWSNYNPALNAWFARAGDRIGHCPTCGRPFDRTHVMSVGGPVIVCPKCDLMILVKRMPFPTWLTNPHASWFDTTAPRLPSSP